MSCPTSFVFAGSFYDEIQAAQVGYTAGCFRGSAAGFTVSCTVDCVAGRIGGRDVCALAGGGVVFEESVFLLSFFSLSSA